MDRSVIDLEYLGIAYRLAEAKSTDPSTQNGAVIVSRNDIPVYTIIGEGANHFPKGVVEKDERWQRPAKYSWVEHAERNAIYDAARKGHKTEGGVMYAAWAACADCARAIIQAGIVEVVTHLDPHAETRFGKPVADSWKSSIAVALTMFEEAGVKLTWIDRKIGRTDGIKIRFNGDIVYP